jgi:hypothetical protein
MLKNDKQVELIRSYQRLFRTEDGKKVLDDLMKFCNFENTSVCESDPNAYQTFFAEGKRRVILRINSFLKEKIDE